MTHTQTNTALAWNDKRADSKTFPFLSAMKHACAHTHMWTHAHTHSDCWYLKVSAERRSVIRDVNDVHITKSRLLKIVLPFHLSPLRRAPSLSPKASPASMWRNTHVISCDTACHAHARTHASHTTRAAWPLSLLLSKSKQSVMWWLLIGASWVTLICLPFIVAFSCHPVTEAEHSNTLTSQAAAHPNYNATCSSMLALKFQFRLI